MGRRRQVGHVAAALQAFLERAVAKRNHQPSKRVLSFSRATLLARRTPFESALAQPGQSRGPGSLQGAQRMIGRDRQRRQPR